MPVYLWRLKIFGLPTNLLEMLVGVLLLGWMTKWLIGRIYELKEFKDKKEQNNKEKRNIRRKLQDKKILLYIGISLLIIGVGLATAFSSNKLTSLGILKSWFIVPLIFAFILSETIIATSKKLQIKAVVTVLKSFALSGLAVSLVSIGYLLERSLTYDGRLKAFYQHPNQLAMYLAPTWLVAYGLWILASKRKEKIFWLISLLVISIPLFFTYSYGAWMGIITAGATVWGLKGIKRDIRDKKGEGLKLSKVKTLISLVVLFSLITFIILTQLNQPKFRTILTNHRSSFYSRLMIWRSSLLILRNNWLLGIGPGTFQSEYLAYQKYFPPYLEWAVPQPHNIFLAFWLETGIMGFAGFILILIWFFKTGTMGIKKETRGFKEEKEELGGVTEDKKIAILLMAIMVYTLIHGLVDTTYWKNDLAMIFWLVIVLMVAIQGIQGIKGGKKGGCGRLRRI